MLESSFIHQLNFTHHPSPALSPPIPRTPHSSMYASPLLAPSCPILSAIDFPLSPESCHVDFCRKDFPPLFSPSKLAVALTVPSRTPLSFRPPLIDVLH